MRLARILTVPMIVAVAMLLEVPAFAAAQDHVVPPADLHHAEVAQARTRQENIAQVQSFFSSPRVDKAMKTARLNPTQVRKAVPTLNDRELAQLAAKSAQAQKDFAAGSLTNEQITYIIIALATAIIVLIATR